MKTVNKIWPEQKSERHFDKLNRKKLKIKNIYNLKQKANRTIKTLQNFFISSDLLKVQSRSYIDIV